MDSAPGRPQLGTANLTVEMAAGSQLSATASKGICEQVGWVQSPTDAGAQAGAGGRCADFVMTAGFRCVTATLKRSPSPFAHARQTRTGIGLTTDEATCRSYWGMMTILNGSTPRRHHPRSAASVGDITQVGSSCCNFFTLASGHDP